VIDERPGGRRMRRVSWTGRSSSRHVSRSWRSRRARRSPHDVRATAHAGQARHWDPRPRGPQGGRGATAAQGAAGEPGPARAARQNAVNGHDAINGEASQNGTAGQNIW